MQISKNNWNNVIDGVFYTQYQEYLIEVENYPSKEKATILLSKEEALKFAYAIIEECQESE